MMIASSRKRLPLLLLGVPFAFLAATAFLVLLAFFESLVYVCIALLIWWSIRREAREHRALPEAGLGASREARAPRGGMSVGVGAAVREGGIAAARATTASSSS